MDGEQLQAYRAYSQKVAKNRRKHSRKNPMVRKYEEDIMRSKIKKIIEI